MCVCVFVHGGTLAVRSSPSSCWAKGWFWGMDSPAQSLSFPRHWQTLEQSCLQSLTGDKASAGQWSGAGEATKVGGSLGNCDLKAIKGITMGGTFPPLTLPSPMLCLQSGVVRPHLGSGAGPAQGEAPQSSCQEVSARTVTKQEFLYIAFLVEAWV